MDASSDVSVMFEDFISKERVALCLQGDDGGNATYKEIKGIYIYNFLSYKCIYIYMHHYRFMVGVQVFKSGFSEKWWLIFTSTFLDSLFFYFWNTSSILLDSVVSGGLQILFFHPEPHIFSVTAQSADLLL